MKLLIAVGLACLIAVPALGQVPTTIYDIQNGTHPAGTWVSVSGVVVTAGSYELTSSGAYIMVEEPGGGQYSGLEVYWGTAQAADYAHILRGDAVNIQGVVDEYYDMTEIDVSAVGDTVIVCGTCALPLDVITIGEIDEPWEGVLINISCAMTATAADGYGEWTIRHLTDEAVCDDANRIGYTPVPGEWNSVTGCLSWSFGAYKIWLRDINDVVPVEPSGTEQASWGSIKALYQ